MMASRNDASLLPFGEDSPHNRDETPPQPMDPEVLTIGMRLYRRAWDAYREAGCPYGESDESMLIWYSFQAESAGEGVPVGKN